MRKHAAWSCDARRRMVRSVPPCMPITSSTGCSATSTTWNLLRRRRSSSPRSSRASSTSLASRASRRGGSCPTRSAQILVLRAPSCRRPTARAAGGQAGARGRALRHARRGAGPRASGRGLPVGADRLPGAVSASGMSPTPTSTRRSTLAGPPVSTRYRVSTTDLPGRVVHQRGHGGAESDQLVLSVWSERFEVRLDNWFATQQRVVRRLASAFNIELSSERLTRQASIPDASLEAHDVWLRAQLLILRFTPENWNDAAQMLAKAIERVANLLAAVQQPRADEQHVPHRASGLVPSAPEGGAHARAGPAGRAP